MAFSIVNRFCMAFLCGRAGRLTAKTGGFRPGAGAVVVLPWQDGPCFDQAGFNADVKQVSPPQPAPLAARAPLQAPI